MGINGIDAPAGPTVTGWSPADRPSAGVRVGDVVERVDKHEVDSMEDVMALVRHDAPGQPIVVELRRGSRTSMVSATLGAWPWLKTAKTGRGPNLRPGAIARAWLHPPASVEHPSRQP